MLTSAYTGEIIYDKSKVTPIQLFTTEVDFKIEDFLKREFSLGPDLQGGISLEYKADTSSIPDSERSDAMAGLRDIIENRVNLFGVSEPIIQVKKRGDEDRLIVE